MDVIDGWKLNLLERWVDEVTTFYHARPAPLFHHATIPPVTHWCDDSSSPAAHKERISQNNTNVIYLSRYFYTIYQSTKWK